MADLSVDLIAKDGVSGELATYMKNNKVQIGNMRPFLADDANGVERAFMTVHVGGDPTKVENYRTVQANTATLRRDEWKQFDDVIQMVNRERLTGIGDLEAKGLVYNLVNPMGVTVLEGTEMDDVMEVEMTMDGVSRSKNDRPELGTTYLPIPIIHGDYEINARELASSRNSGNGLDVTKAEMVARRIREKLEKLLFTNVSYTKGGGTIWSYINHPDRNLAVATLTWDNASKTGALILADVIAMKAKMLADEFYGPFMLYIPAEYETKMDEDFSAVKGEGTIRERIMKIEMIEGVKVAAHLPAKNVVMVQMTSNVVRLVKGFAMQNVEWKSEGNMITNYKVMTIQVPQIRSNASGQCGIVHYTAQ